MSLDPKVASTLGPYQYVGNDPLNGTDPTGLCVKGDSKDANGTCVKNSNLKGDHEKIADYALVQAAALASFAAQANAELATDQSSAAQNALASADTNAVNAISTAASDLDTVAVDAGETPIFRGVASDHEFFDEAQQGIAMPGDPSGPAELELHNAGFTSGTSLTSWSTDRSVAEMFAGKDGVVLSTTLEEMEALGVPIFASPDAFGESEVLLQGVIRNLGVDEP